MKELKPLDHQPEQIVLIQMCHMDVYLVIGAGAVPQRAAQRALNYE
jgi:hypothetical protein